MFCLLLAHSHTISSPLGKCPPGKCPTSDLLGGHLLNVGIKNDFFAFIHPYTKHN
jgi:hypothetical protein